MLKRKEERKVKKDAGYKEKWCKVNDNDNGVKDGNES